jgi:hypothetical protein
VGSNNHLEVLPATLDRQYDGITRKWATLWVLSSSFWLSGFSSPWGAKKHNQKNKVEKIVGQDSTIERTSAEIGAGSEAARILASRKGCPRGHSMMPCSHIWALAHFSGEREGFWGQSTAPNHLTSLAHRWGSIICGCSC